MRVAALLPAATDIVIALGAGDQLVAVTHACTLPARLSDVPRVTRSRVAATGAAGIDSAVSELSSAGAPLFELDEALLAAQRPDVLLTQAVCDVCAVREEDVRAVASRLRPVPVVVTLGAGSVEGVIDDIAAVGSALGIPDEAEELVAGLQSRIGAIHRRLKASAAPRPNVLVLEWTDPPFNAGHWVPDMVRRAGGHEVLGRTGEKSRRITDDEIRTSSPDIIVIAPCGYALDDAVREAKDLVESASFARSTPVWALDANRLTSSPGPAVVRGIEVLAHVLHPALFGEPSTRDAIKIPR
ncbi:MAG TPA: ABC transporter substrate-binding protein [Gemmatimonadaceae bacterium]|nr:ABC transporter substrate-binding protein [Gemmatimonadaceae bacterium]